MTDRKVGVSYKLSCEECSNKVYELYLKDNKWICRSCYYEEKNEGRNTDDAIDGDSNAEHNSTSR